MYYKRLLIKQLKWCNSITDVDYVIRKKVNFPHPIGITISKRAVIGDNCNIYQNVTLGSRKGGYPTLKDNVTILGHSIIVGDVTIGENSIIGIGSMVMKDVPANVIWAGQPARFIRQVNENDNIY